ncbi:MAG: hypothetical protein U0441_28855 [Polyangiaceae bacterium]
MRPSSLAVLLPALLLLACGPEGVAPIPADSRATSASSASGPASASAATSASSAATSAVAEGGPAPSGSAAAPKSPAIEADPAMAERVAALVKDLPHPADDVGAGFLGPVDPKLDAEWITRMASAEIAEITPNKGGGSVSMRLKFKDGKKAALKAEQTGHPTDPRSEIAAYHLDRLLGFGRTAAVVGRRFDMAKIRAALVASKAEPAFLERLDKLVVRDGHLDAALIAWHTAPLVEEETAPAWATTLADKDPVTKDMLTLLKDWSDLVVFDFLVDNPDRFSGGNILRLDKGGPIVFLDQGAAFGRGRLAAKQTTMDRLSKVCRFRRETLSALKKVGSAAGKDGSLGAQLAKSLAKDPLSPVLDDAQIRGVDERMKMLEAHVKACSAKMGEAVLLSAAP